MLSVFAARLARRADHRWGKTAGSAASEIASSAGGTGRDKNLFAPGAVESGLYPAGKGVQTKVGAWNATINRVCGRCGVE